MISGIYIQMGWDGVEARPPVELGEPVLDIVWS